MDSVALNRSALASLLFCLLSLASCDAINQPKPDAVASGASANADTPRKEIENARDKLKIAMESRVFGDP